MDFDMTDGKKMWPQFVAAIDPEPAVAFLDQWCREHSAKEHTKNDCKQALKGYLKERFEEVSREELMDALAETSAATIIKCLDKHYGRKN